MLQLSVRARRPVRLALAVLAAAAAPAAAQTSHAAGKIAIRRPTSGSSRSGSASCVPGVESGGSPTRCSHLLYLDGRSLLRVPLEDRKRLLRSVLREGSRVRFASHVETEGLAFHAAAEQRGIEGILAKLRRSNLRAGTADAGMAQDQDPTEQELVVGGWTPGEGNAKDGGALIVGVYEDGKLRYAGKVGSGFNAKVRSDLRKRLEALAADKPAFDPASERKGELRSAQWIRPELVIRAELGGWTREGYVRQTSFKGLEIAKDPTDVARERPMATSKAVQEAETMTRKSGGRGTA